MTKDWWALHLTVMPDSKSKGIPRAYRPATGMALRDYIDWFDPTVVFMLIKAKECYLLVLNMPQDGPARRKLVGYAKRKGTTTLRKWLPEFRWATGYDEERIARPERLAAWFRQVAGVRGADDWCWGSPAIHADLPNQLKDVVPGRKIRNARAEKN